MTGGPWYNISICKKLHGKVFEGFIINARTDRYNIMCSIDAYEKEHQLSSCDDGISGGGCPLTTTSMTEALESLGATIDFIGCWLKALEHNFLERCNLYTRYMEELFHKIPGKLPNKPSPKEKRKSLLHAIGGGWYVEKLGQKLPPLKKRKLSKKYQKYEDKIKRRLTESNQEWNDRKFQIHWNKLEWVNPRSHDERKNSFFVSSKKMF